MENEFVRTLSVLHLTKSEMAEMDAIIQNMDYACGDDGWIPSLKDVEEKLIGRYFDKVNELRANTFAKMPDKRKMNECREDMKRLWFFMYWIVETCPEMDPVAYERLSKFVDSKVQVE